jgi:hypothetical protein
MSIKKFLAISLWLKAIIFTGSFYQGICSTLVVTFSDIHENEQNYPYMIHEIIEASKPYSHVIVLGNGDYFTSFKSLPSKKVKGIFNKKISYKNSNASLHAGKQFQDLFLVKLNERLKTLGKKVTFLLNLGNHEFKYNGKLLTFSKNLKKLFPRNAFLLNTNLSFVKSGIPEAVAAEKKSYFVHENSIFIGYCTKKCFFARKDSSGLVWFEKDRAGESMKNSAKKIISAIESAMLEIQKYKKLNIVIASHAGRKETQLLMKELQKEIETKYPKLNTAKFFVVTGHEHHEKKGIFHHNGYEELAPLPYGEGVLKLELSPNPRAIIN